MISGGDPMDMLDVDSKCINLDDSASLPESRGDFSDKRRRLSFKFPREDGDASRKLFRTFSVALGVLMRTRPNAALGLAVAGVE